MMSMSIKAPSPTLAQDTKPDTELGLRDDFITFVEAISSIVSTADRHELQLVGTGRKKCLGRDQKIETKGHCSVGFRRCIKSCAHLRSRRRRNLIFCAEAMMGYVQDFAMQTPDFGYKFTKFAPPSVTAISTKPCIVLSWVTHLPRV